MNELCEEIKSLIIDALNLEDLTPADIDNDAPLCGDDGLGLDSVDALELGLAVQKHFDFRIEANNTELRESFKSVASLANYIKKIKGL